MIKAVSERVASPWLGAIPLSVTAQVVTAQFIASWPGWTGPSGCGRCGFGPPVEPGDDATAGNDVGTGDDVARFPV